MMIHAICWALIKQAHSTTYLDISVTKADKVHGAYLLKCESVYICMLMYGCVYDAYTCTCICEMMGVVIRSRYLFIAHVNSDPTLGSLLSLET